MDNNFYTDTRSLLTDFASLKKEGRYDESDKKRSDIYRLIFINGLCDSNVLDKELSDALKNPENPKTRPLFDKWVGRSYDVDANDGKAYIIRKIDSAVITEVEIPVNNK